MEEEERAEGHFGRSRLIHFYAAQHIWAVAPTQPHRTGTSAGQPHRSGTLCPAAPQIWASAAIAPQIWDIMPSSPTDLGVCSHSPTDLGGGWQLAAKPHRFGSKSGLATDLGHFFSKPHRFGFIPFLEPPSLPYGLWAIQPYVRICTTKTSFAPGFLPGPQRWSRRGGHRRAVAATSPG
jgi:hypothetical protein